MYEENEEFEREMNYQSPSQVTGDAVAKEFSDGQEEEEIKYLYYSKEGLEIKREDGIIYEVMPKNIQKHGKI